MQKFMPYSSNASSVEAIAHRLLKQQKGMATKGSTNLNESSIAESSYDNNNQQMLFTNHNLNN